MAYPGTKTMIGKALAAMTGKVQGTYREPFAGMASVFNAFANNKSIDHAVLSDTNKGVIDILQGLKNNSDSIISGVSEKLASFRPEEQSPFNYFLKIAGEGDKGNETDKAIQNIILTSIAGNVPGQQIAKPRVWGVPGEKFVWDLKKFADNLQMADIKHGDWKSNLPKSGKDFTMFDPPYVGLKPSRNYGISSGDSLKLNQAIKEFLESSNNKGEGVIFNSPRGINELYKGLGDVMEFSIGGRHRVKQPAVLYPGS